MSSRGYGPGHRRIAWGAACLSVTVAGLAVAGPPALAARDARVPRAAGHTAGYGFDQPDAIAVAGADLYVANAAGDSVSVVDGRTGAHVATIRGPRFHLDGPTALIATGPEAADVFVADGRGNSVTEIATATRSVVRVITHLSDPIALASRGGRTLFVLSGAGAVTKVDIRTGAVAGVASGKRFDFNTPTAIAAAGGDLYVANRAGNSVTELSAATMSLVAVLSGSPYDFDSPSGMTTYHGGVWVTNTAGQSITELSAGTDKVAQVVPNTDDYLPTPGPITAGDGSLFAASPPGSSPMITRVVPSKPATLPWMMCNTNGPYTFSNPQALAVQGRNLWVVNEGGAGGPAGDSLTEMRARSGSLVTVLR